MILSRLSSLRSGLVLGGLLAILALNGCKSTPPAPSYPELTYGHYGIIGLDVASIEFVSTYIPPQKPPHVEHLSPASPILAMERWTNDRLRAMGREGVARVVVSNASIIETPLQVTGGVRGWFTTDQAARYDATIEVEVQIRDAGGVQRAFTRRQGRTLEERAGECVDPRSRTRAVRSGRGDDHRDQHRTRTAASASSWRATWCSNEDRPAMLPGSERFRPKWRPVRLRNATKSRLESMVRSIEADHALVAPEARHQHDNQRHEFQPAEQHADGEQQLGAVGNSGEVADRADHVAQSGADVAKRGRGARNGG